MNKILTSTIAAIAFGVATFAHAGERPVVVELYTSQGCSSCPPADAMLNELSKHENVIALALHVDYWDYIGWKDTFGSPAFTKRQKLYARAAKQRSVYTPQVIVGGKDHIIGTRPMQLMDTIAHQQAQMKNVDVGLTRTGSKISISIIAGPNEKLERNMAVQLVRFLPSQDVKITRGENAGKTVRYANIVTELQSIGSWDGKGPKTISAEVGNSDARIAVIVQNDGHGPIVAAAMLP